MHSTQGIILKIADFRERDLRVVLYTKNLGKIELIAKGAKRIDAKLRGNLDILNFVDAGFVEGKNFNILIRADFLDSFCLVIKNTHAWKAALSAASLVDYVFGENAADAKFFDDLHHTLSKLNEYSHESEQLSSLYSWLLLKKLQIKILESQGYEYNFGGKKLNAVMEERENGFKFSNNSSLLLKMLSGEGIESVRMSKSDFLNIENVFSRIFAYIFNYKSCLWTPIVT